MNLERYLVIPYREGGRDETGCDCWGFVRIVLHDEAGLTLPEFSWVRDKAGVDEAANGFRETLLPQDFDIVYMHGYGFLTHVGVYYQGGVLHMTTSGPSFQALRTVRRRVIAFYSPR